MASASFPRARGSGLAPTGTSTTPTTTSPTTTTGTSTTSGGTGLGAPSTGAGDSTGAQLPVATFLRLGLEDWSSGSGITVGFTSTRLLGQRISFSGSVPATDVGDSVLIRYASTTAPDGWVQAAQTAVVAPGSFSAVWRAQSAGLLAFTATIVPPGAVPAADLLSTSFTVEVFSPAIATIYGPGLWGHRTACGERLRKTTIGVASRTLKCGTDVAVHYGNRELVVPVIDRGPFANRAAWDLTSATAKALGLSHTAKVDTIEPWPQSQQPSARS